jgi:hypothetical protein
MVKEIAQNISTREALVTIPPKTISDLNFSETTPNYVHINNYSGGTIYFGKSVLPSNTVYDMIVDGYGDNLYATPNGFKKAYIYNDGADNVNLKITSFQAPFEPSSLKGGGGTATSTSTGGPAADVRSTIVGFNVPIPAGDNNIGRVVVSSMPAQTFALDTLPAGTNHIGSVTVDQMPALAEGVSHIGTVGIDGGVTITSMPPVQVSDQPVKQSHQYYEGAVDFATYTPVVFDFAGDTINQVIYCKNDGDTDLYLSFDSVDASIPANRANGLNMAIRIAAGEAISDLPRKADKVQFFRIAGNGAVRFLGV